MAQIQSKIASDIWILSENFREKKWNLQLKQ